MSNDTDTMNIAADYTMINPKVEAVRYEGTEEHMAEEVLDWVCLILDLDPEDTDVTYRAVTPSQPETTQWDARILIDPDDEGKDIKVSPGDWLVAKRGTEDDLFRIRVWKDENFRRTFRRMGL